MCLGRKQRRFCSPNKNRSSGLAQNAHRLACEIPSVSTPYRQKKDSVRIRWHTPNLCQKHTHKNSNSRKKDNIFPAKRTILLYGLSRNLITAYWTFWEKTDLLSLVCGTRTSCDQLCFLFDSHTLSLRFQQKTWWSWWWSACCLPAAAAAALLHSPLVTVSGLALFRVLVQTAREFVVVT